MFENLLMNDPALDPPEMEMEETTVIMAREIKDPPKEPDKLAKEWARKI